MNLQKQCYTSDFWAFSFVSHTLYFIMISLRGAISDFTSMALSNILAMTGLLFLMFGIEQFFGLKRSNYHNIFFLFVFSVVQIWFTVFDEDLAMRIVNISALTAVFSFQCAWLLFFKIEQKFKEISIFPAVVLFFFSIGALARILEFFIVGNTASDYFTSGVFNAVVLLFYQMLYILLTYSFVLIFNGRLIIDVRSKESEQIRTLEDLKNEIGMRKGIETELMKNEEKLRNLVTQMQLGLAVHEIILDDTSSPVDYRFIDVNPAFERITGLKRAEIVGRTMLEILPETEKFWIERYGRVALTGEPTSFEDYASKLDRYYSVVAYRPQTNQFAVVVEDVTQRHKAEEKLKDNLALLRIAGEVTKLGGWSVNLKEGRAYWSDVVARIHEMPAGFSPLIEEGINFYAPEWRERIFRVFVDCATKGTPYNEKMEIVTSTGRRVWIKTIGEAVRNENGEIFRVNGAFQDITDEVMAERKLEKNRRFLSEIIENNNALIFVKNIEGRYELVNSKWESVTGFSRNSTIGRTDMDLFDGETGRQFHENDMAVVNSGQIIELEEILKNGSSVRYFNSIKFPLKDDSDRMVGICGMSTEITEKKKAEIEKERLRKQLYQAQKMESIGRLAGGIAHDFNNMLSVIIGRTDLALMKVSDSDPLQRELVEIKFAADRSADLTSQLLAFARKQVVSPRVISLNEEIDKMCDMLKRLIGENIDLKVKRSVDLWDVSIDPAQVDQIVANLCINARDAISGRGNILIETRNIVIERMDLSQMPGMCPGEYVMLSITDDGSGIEENVREHVFEPFYTTKEMGKGTGLGLSTTFGIVKQNSGFIYFDSVVGEGTVFKVFLPRIVQHDAKDQMPPPEKRTVRCEGRHKVLFVEDDPAILKMGARMMEIFNYDVIPVGSPVEALKKLSGDNSGIDMLVTDMMMPEMDGLELSRKIRSVNPGVKCLFISGHTADILGDGLLSGRDIHFLQKPFTMNSLGKKMTEIFNGEENEK